MMIQKNTIHKIWVFLLAVIVLLTSMNVGSFAYTSQVGTVKANSVNVRSGPGTGYSRIASLKLGAQVVVTEEVTGTDGQTWCAILYNNGASQGFMAKAYIAMGSSYEGVSDGSFEQMLTNQKFPETYKPYLRALHNQYPNWTFTAVNTGLDWNTVIKQESIVGRNLVYKDSVSSWKSTADGAFDWDNNYWPGYDGSSWQAASEGIVSYYMDPRNFLDATYVFQFLDQSYNSNIHSYTGVESMVRGTFMESRFTGALAGAAAAATVNAGSSSSAGNTGAPTGSGNIQLIGPGQASSQTAADSSTAAGPVSSSQGSADSAGPGGALDVSSGSATYVDMIMKAAEQSGVNPYVLTSMIIQEQGTAGTSASISGSHSGYPGVYNFYNVEAYASGGMDAVTRGLWWASQSGSYDRPWNSREASIVGGARFYGEGYLKKGQNTFYLKKFNVTGTNTYKHQYMTNVQAAASEGYHLAQAYTSELRTAAHNFEIPVYKNMPDSPASLPTVDGSPNNKLNGLGVEGFSLTPTFSKDTLSYDLIVDPSVTSVNISASRIDANATVTGTGTVSLANGTNKINIVVKAQNGDQRVYVLNVVRQSGGPTYTSGLGSVTQTSVVGQSGNMTGPGGSSVTSGPATGTTGSSSASGSSDTSGPVIVINAPPGSSQNTGGTGTGTGTAGSNGSGSGTGTSASSGSAKKPTVVLIGPGQ